MRPTEQEANGCYSRDLRVDWARVIESTRPLKRWAVFWLTRHCVQPVGLVVLHGSLSSRIAHEPARDGSLY